MRIGIDCRLWNETGVGRYTRNLVRELVLVDKRNEYILFALRRDAEKIKFEVRSSKFEVRIADIRWHTLKEQIVFPGILDKEKLDLMHFPYFSVPIFYNGPFVVTIHDLIINHYPTGQASTLPYPLYLAKLYAYKLVISRAARKAKKVITVSEATKNEIIDHLRIPATKVAVTYEGADIAIEDSNYQYTSISALGSYFLYVGNAYPHKNLERLIAAFSKVKDKHKDISLVLVGRDDFFYRKLKEEHEKTPGVVFKKVADDQELACYYKHARALIIPSLMEGFGLPPLEAMANSCLVLASSIPSLREICDNGAMYFDPKNVSEMASKMNEVLSLTREQKASMTEKGEKRTKQFSWKKMAEETLAVYESCTK